MNLLDIVISAIGSAALIGAVAWLSKNWIKARLENAIKYEYSVKLESHKNELKVKTDKLLLELKNQADIEFEKYKVRVGPYSEKQFERYNELWVKMVELKYGMSELWDHAGQDALERFSGDLRELVNTLEKSALLVEPEHYKELMGSMNVFAQYQFGKQTLIDLRKISGDRYVEGVTEQISQLIRENEESRRRLLKALDNLMDPMRKQINGAIG
ncbi:hypothetical protein ACFQH5_19200 [Halomonas salifodinae]|uniref:Uncharacterized protein n=1 Tax=Halomonas salifodinae TaxID=438745 RepID=A0ABW2F6K6_9GAMM